MCKLGLSGGMTKGTQARPSSSSAAASALRERLAPPNSSGTSSPQRPSSLQRTSKRVSSSSESLKPLPSASRFRIAGSSGISSLSTKRATRSCNMRVSSVGANGKGLWSMAAYPSLWLQSITHGPGRQDGAAPCPAPDGFQKETASPTEAPETFWPNRYRATIRMDCMLKSQTPNS